MGATTQVTQRSQTFLFVQHSCRAWLVASHFNDSSSTLPIDQKVFTKNPTQHCTFHSQSSHQFTNTPSCQLNILKLTNINLNKSLTQQWFNSMLNFFNICLLNNAVKSTNFQPNNDLLTKSYSSYSLSVLVKRSVLKWLMLNWFLLKWLMLKWLLLKWLLLKWLLLGLDLELWSHRTDIRGRRTILNRFEQWDEAREVENRPACNCDLNGCNKSSNPPSMQHRNCVQLPREAREAENRPACNCDLNGCNKKLKPSQRAT